MKEKLESLIRDAVQNVFELYEDPEYAADSAVAWVMTGIAKEIEEMEKKKMEQKKGMSRKTYIEIYDLIDDRANEAMREVESACDRMVEFDTDPGTVAGVKLVGTIKENRRKYNEMRALLERFEKEVEEPEM